MNRSELQTILDELEEEGNTEICRHCGSIFFDVEDHAFFGAYVVCAACSHEHHFTFEIPNVPHYA